MGPREEELASRKEARMNEIHLETEAGTFSKMALFRQCQTSHKQVTNATRHNALRWGLKERRMA